MITASQGFGRASSGGTTNGIDPLTGKLLWTYTGFNCWIPVAHAVDAGQGRMLLAGGYNAGSTMIQVAKKDDGPTQSPNCSRAATSGPTRSRLFCIRTISMRSSRPTNGAMVW